MDDDKPAVPYSAAADLEAAWQFAGSSLQLLAMLDVVYDWDRGDAVEVGASATQAESLARAMAPVPSGAGLTGIERLLQMLDGVVLRGERLARLAPAQSRDDASGGAMASALRRLAAASAELRSQLAAAQPELPPQPDPGAGA
ncbi:hypothetical protein ACFPPF_08945 [Xenophilus aerolatus]|nr:hypothetical protein [Xenophilus aerolatus]